VIVRQRPLSSNSRPANTTHGSHVAAVVAIIGDVAEPSPNDAPRLLARRSELGYVHYPVGAVPGEPEAVSAAEQQRQTLETRRRERAKQRAAWTDARALIVDGVTIARASHLPRSIVSATRVISRVVDRIDQQLGPI
jgi:hypothetical protein